MRKRDLDILNSLEKFRCLERDQIAALHFSNNSNPIVNCNRVLKRLRDNGYIQANTDRAFQQYIYFLKPSPMKKDSQKIDHFLMIAQTYIDMLKYSTIKEYEIEPKLGDFIPDVYVKGWLNNNWFVECQNSLYTTNQLYSKLDKYVDYFNRGNWNNERVLIIGKVNLKFNPDDYPYKVKQVKCIDDLKGMIEEYKKVKEREKIKSVNGGIKYVV